MSADNGAVRKTFDAELDATIHQRRTRLSELINQLTIPAPRHGFNRACLH
ncbi:MAG: hypothetical protein ABI268_10675 [Rhodanobacter sp.]